MIESHTLPHEVSTYIYIYIICIDYTSKKRMLLINTYLSREGGSVICPQTSREESVILSRVCVRIFFKGRIFIL